MLIHLDKGSDDHHHPEGKRCYPESEAHHVPGQSTDKTIFIMFMAAESHTIAKENDTSCTVQYSRSNEL